MKAIAYRNEPQNGSLAGFLNNYNLLNRVIANEPYMGVSIKILHGLIQKGCNQIVSKLDTLTITQIFFAVNEIYDTP
jgi:hypothetical protein